MSTYSKNLFDILGDGEVPRPQPVKEEAAPVVVDKKNVSKINKDGKLSFFNSNFFFRCFSLCLNNTIYTAKSNSKYFNSFYQQNDANMSLGPFK